jgi:hypothetical protein
VTAKHTLPQLCVIIKNNNRDPSSKTTMKALINLYWRKYNKKILPKNIQIKKQHTPLLYTNTYTTYTNHKKIQKYPKIRTLTPKNKLTKRTVYHTPNSCKTKIKMVTQMKIKTPSYTFHNIITLLKCGDIESNPRPRNTLFLNHLQIHQERQKNIFLQQNHPNKT